jgi:hypothetical protein
MPVIVNSGKYGGKGLSVEQLALQHYDYFAWIIDNYRVPGDLRQRVKFVEFVANNFVSQELCSLNDCGQTARYISIYETHNQRVNFGGFVYCSEKHFDIDPERSIEGKAHLYRLGFRAALPPTGVYAVKSDVKTLVKRISGSMGLKNRGLTKEYLEEFFDHAKTWQ